MTQSNHQIMTTDPVLPSDKKRVLVVSEFSELNTGFSVMTKELLARLHKSGKYELAELASYVNEDSPKLNTNPWKTYAAQPSLNKKKRTEEFNRTYNTAQFGGYVFNDVLLDFKPDVVLSWRDFWHDEFITQSPYRPYYKYIWSTCVDSEPPQQHWLNVFSTVDVLSSYSQWGLNVLKKYGGQLLQHNVSDTDTMPGVDTNIFKPMDRKAIRDKFGLSEDANIIMMCARNQLRKLYPELIRSFMRTIEQLNNAAKYEIANNSFLLLHTSVNDVGWDIIKEIQKYGAGNKVLLSYHCLQCKASYVAYFNGDHCHCPFCKTLSCLTPNTGLGASREQLAEIYNIADLYVQTHIAGALEIPILEAKACGLPVLCTAYAAPYEINRSPGSFDMIDVKMYRQESIKETGQFRGYLDEEDLSRKMTKFLLLSENSKRELRKLSRQSAEKYHSYDLTAEKWMKLIDAIEPLDPNRWYQRPRIINLDRNQLPQNLSDIQFVRWCCEKLLPYWHPKQFFNSEKTMLEQINKGFCIDPITGKNKPYNREIMINEFAEEINKINHFELHRYNILVNQPTKNTNDINFIVT